MGNPACSNPRLVDAWPGIIYGCHGSLVPMCCNAAMDSKHVGEPATCSCTDANCCNPDSFVIGFKLAPLVLAKFPFVVIPRALNLRHQPLPPAFCQRSEPAYLNSKKKKKSGAFNSFSFLRHDLIALGDCRLFLAPTSLYNVYDDFSDIRQWARKRANLFRKPSNS